MVALTIHATIPSLRQQDILLCEDSEYNSHDTSHLLSGQFQMTLVLKKQRS